MIDNKVKDTVISIKNLHVHYVTEDEIYRAVNGLNLEILKGEVVGLVGETGAGKTTTALSIMQLVPDPPGIIVDGEIYYDGKNIIRNTEKENRIVRGNGISMIFQDPMTALNPIMTIGEQLEEVVETHEKMPKQDIKKRVVDMLETVGINKERYNDYPHQFSGGMKQRVVIAMALLCKPQLLIADEPTTALDVTIQAQILNIMQDLIKKFDMSMLLITHDLGVVAETCNKVCIMYAGEIVESGNVEDVFEQPKHPYTVGLFGSIPKIDEDVAELSPIKGSVSNSSELPDGCYFYPRCPYAKDICMKEKPEIKGDNHMYRCHFDISKLVLNTGEDKNTTIDKINIENKTEVLNDNIPNIANEKPLLEVRNLKKYFPLVSGYLHAVDDVSFAIPRGKTLGIVGESGCGKSTLGRTVLRLHEPTAGSILYDGMDITNFNSEEMRKLRQNFQIIFQDPYASLNPRMSVSQIIGEPLTIHKKFSEKQALQKRILELMSLVGLSKKAYNNYPHEFDGGRRQRIVIARAIAMNPEFIVCDEPVSALDVSVQAQILNLLMQLQKQIGLTYMFISHDLSVVKHISDEIGVMYLGQLIERAPKNEIFYKPLHPYTIALLSAIPSITVNKKTSRILLKGEIVSPINPKKGCRFESRCPFAIEICSKITPSLKNVACDHFVACHRWNEIENGNCKYSNT